MSQIQDGRFTTSDIAVDRSPVDPMLQDLITNALSRLLGYSDIEDRWLRIRVDSDGRLLTSSQQTPGQIANTSRVTANTVNALALAANADRRSLTIKNTGLIAVFIGFTVGNTALLGFQVDPNQTLVMDNYVGDIYVITASSSTALHIIEVS